MARNAIQFQKGLSEAEFQARYGTEELCEAAVKRMRRSNGFVCPECRLDKGFELHTRAVCQCAKCRTQTSLTAGIIFHRTKLPLTTWFRAMYHLTQSKNGVSALELMRRLGVSYNSAWMLKHKLMQVSVPQQCGNAI